MSERRHTPRRRIALRRDMRLGERLAYAVASFASSATAFVLALASVAVWALLGPVFHYSDTWQLVINTGTTVVTFLMVFLIQRTQAKESLALQLKVNELIASLEGPSNRLVDIESVNEEDLDILRRHFSHLAVLAQDTVDIRESHSVDEAERRHADKKRKPRRQS